MKSHPVNEYALLPEGTKMLLINVFKPAIMTLMLPTLSYASPLPFLSCSYATYGVGFLLIADAPGGTHQAESVNFTSGGADIRVRFEGIGERGTVEVQIPGEIYFRPFLNWNLPNTADVLQNSIEVEGDSLICNVKRDR